jgi:2-methylisocitrate lyase-like PEP mutase family enzyme
VITQQQKAKRFRALHERDGAFLIPNPWDAGSARILEGLGFEALATTSSGFAQTLGRRDGNVTLEEKLAHCRALCGATTLPISVDLENGFGHAPVDVQATIVAVAATGAVGGSIEDFDGTGIYQFDMAVERVRAAVEAARALAVPFTLTARAENLLHGVDDLDDTIRRLQAFEAAGAHVLYAPGLKTLEQVRRVCASVTRPVNILAPGIPNASLAELADAGARRVSVGGALALASLAPLLEAGREMLEQGTFGWLGQLSAAAEARKHLL